MTRNVGNAVIAQRAFQSQQPMMCSRSDNVTIGAKHQNLPIVGKATASEFDCLHLLSSHRLYRVAPQFFTAAGRQLNPCPSLRETPRDRPADFPAGSGDEYSLTWKHGSRGTVISTATGQVWLERNGHRRDGRPFRRCPMRRFSLPLR